MNQINIHHSVAELDKLKWEHILKKNSNFLSLSFLKHFEKLDKSELLPFYISTNDSIIYGHLITIKGKKAANYLQSKNGFSLKKSILKKIDFHFFCFGNTHFSNTSTFSNSKNELNEKVVLELISKIKKDFKVNFFLVPDHFHSKINPTKTQLSNKFNVLTIDPDMALKIDQKWLTLDDYSEAIQSKYKKRLRKVLKKSKELVVKEFQLSDLQDNLQNMKELYNNVYSKSAFSGPKFDLSIYLDFIKNENLKFYVFGFFHEKKLIGFSSDFLDNKNLQSYFIGLNYDFNKQFDLYNRILIHTIQQGIKLKVNQIKFGRTAAEFKSTIGAIPSESKSSVYIANNFLYFLFKPIIKKIKPKPWVQRRPFKEA
jgi:predicted N-acyltransferase